MMKKTAKILRTQFVTHDVKQFIVERPEGYEFAPGQATLVSINQPGLDDEDHSRPFTFTSLEEDRVLEFTIKGYFDHDGVTRKLHGLRPGDELVLRDVWGTITYKGPGVFIAGGAGLTPFLAILRRLAADGRMPGHKLIFANKTRRDVIDWMVLAHHLGDDLILAFSQEKVPETHHGRVTRDFLAERIDDFSQHFYVCGPPPMIDSVMKDLKDLGAEPDSLVFEEG
jgi:hypothetical protein